MNYCGIIAKIAKTEQIEKADNIQVAYVLGEPVIVSKTAKEGDLGVYFPAETQLSHDYVSDNGLYRNSENNKNPKAKGFFEDNRRVRAQPFLGVKSCGYFAGLESFHFTGYDISKLELGMMFEELNGVPIAQKYINPRTKKAQANQRTKARKKQETPLFHQHVDTDQFKYHVDRIPAGSIISIQAKGHGTSARYSHTLVEKELPWWKRLVNKVVPIFETQEWDYVAGTRRVVLKNSQKDKEGFHGNEGFRFEILEQLKPFLNRGVTVYGEIVGFANGKPIMGTHDVTKLKDKQFTKKYGKEITYTYNCLPDEYKFYAYRVTITSIDGTEIDLTQSQFKRWCEDRGIESTLDLVEPFVYRGDSDSLMNVVDVLTEREDNLCEDYRDPSHISEGVVIRVDGETLVPKFYKNKSIPFKILEGIYRENNVDMEDSS
ncbi:MAG: putative RNA ligase [Prokaryotic dsDNA virus sp.]|nr:MAG: putative RNA ligase [Prokaryotic dsDNA virus sp.]